MSKRTTKINLLTRKIDALKRNKSALESRINDIRFNISRATLTSQSYEMTINTYSRINSFSKEEIDKLQKSKDEVDEYILNETASINKKEKELEEAQSEIEMKEKELEEEKMEKN